MNYHVRDAKPAEVFRLAEISRVTLQESVYKHMAFDAVKVANYLYDGIAGRSGVFLRVIADGDDQVVGGVMCYCEESIFGPDKIAYDITIIVELEHRGKCFKQLLQIIQEYKEWAIIEGAKLIKFGVSSGINIERAAAFFDRLGFERVGSMHAMRVGA